MHTLDTHITDDRRLICVCYFIRYIVRNRLYTNKTIVQNVDSCFLFFPSPSPASRGEKRKLGASQDSLRFF